MSIQRGRNDLCHCGSGKKYKRCHLDEDRQRERKANELQREDSRESNQITMDMDEMRALPALSHGLMAALNEDQARQRAVLRELGLEPERLEQMSPAEIEAWIRQQDAEPSKNIAEVIRAHPEEFEFGKEKVEALANQYMAFMASAEAQSLLLPFEELGKWISFIEQTIKEVSQASSAIAKGDSIVRKLTAAIFAKPRIEELRTQFKNYANDCFAVGDMSTGSMIVMILTFIEEDCSPDENFFLLTYCYFSLHSFIYSHGESAGDDQQLQDRA